MVVDEHVGRKNDAARIRRELRPGSDRHASLLRGTRLVGKHVLSCVEHSQRPCAAVIIARRRAVAVTQIFGQIELVAKTLVKRLERRHCQVFLDLLRIERLGSDLDPGFRGPRVSVVDRIDSDVAAGR